MFRESKYTQWYYSIVEKAKQRTLSGYKERHHILPRSLGGGDDETNLVNLTAREHFICHILLVKMTTGNHRYKMMCAIMRMSKKDTLKSRTYQWVKEEFAKEISRLHSGKKLPETHKANIGKSIKGRKQNPEWIRKRTTDVWTGRKHKAESLEKMSQSHKGISRSGWNHTEETKIKLKNWHAENKPSLGLKRSDETKAILREQNLGANNPNYGKKWWNNGSCSKLSAKQPGPEWVIGRLKKVK